ncbi:MAG: GNAT family N-acetyltransferase [Planctomycetota bacterium]
MNDPPSNPAITRLSGELLVRAVSRMMPGTGPHRRTTAEQFLTGCRKAGLDLSRAFGLVETAQGREPWVRQACLAVPGPGRTAMLLVTGPIGRGGEREQDLADRAAVIDAAGASCSPPEIVLAQALPSAEEAWAVDAYRRSGFEHVGDLAYLERAMEVADRGLPQPHWPEGVAARAMASLEHSSGDRADLHIALEASYEGTLDCPRLCGLRATEDIIDSHQATGVFDPTNWLLLTEQGEPIGCSLVSLVPETSSAELVYLGLAPAARGRGLAKQLLSASLRVAAHASCQRIVCAVDRRNTPAWALYKNAGFREFSARVAFVSNRSGASHAASGSVMKHGRAVDRS